MSAPINIPEKSLLIQIMNEVDELSDSEKDYILYWLKASKSSSFAKKGNDSILPNDISLSDIYEERNGMRSEK